MSIDRDIPDELAAPRRVVHAARSRFASSPPGKFVKAMVEAVRDYLTARSIGVPRADAIKGLEMVIRDEWPIRFSPRHHVCADCDDTGWQLRQCRHGARCDRQRCGIAEPTWEHAYAAPCACPRGDRIRRPMPASAEDQLAAVGRRKKRPPKQFQQVTR